MFDPAFFLGAYVIIFGGQSTSVVIQFSLQIVMASVKLLKIGNIAIMGDIFPFGDWYWLSIVVPTYPKMYTHKWSHCVSTLALCS